MMSNNAPKNRLTNIIEEATGGKSYKSYKYCVDEISDSSLEYGEPEPSFKWNKKGETRPEKKYVQLYDLSKVAKNPALFSYFLDGSRHIYKVDDIGCEKSGNRTAIYPVMAWQVGVVCCNRKDRRLKVERFINEIILTMPDIADPNNKRGFWEGMRDKLNRSAEMELVSAQGWRIGAVLPYKAAYDEKTYKDKGVATIQKEMMDKEQELVAQLVSEKKLGEGKFLVKDGSLEYLPSTTLRNDKHACLKYKNNYAYVIGVSKRFNPKICKDSNDKPNPGFIPDLPLYSRTPAAYFEDKNLGDIKFAVWYLRIREVRRTLNPFDGIIKIEKMLVSNEEIENGIDTDLANLITAQLINERNPVCFGRDSRWANHLYPIYLTELYAESRYISTAAFLHLF